MDLIKIKLGNLRTEYNFREKHLMTQTNKMEENKYYAPSIEEFHDGFEFELFNYDKEEYQKEALGFKDFYSPIITEQIKNNKCRVKFLDKEDIEAEGFEYDNNHEPIPPRKDSLELPKSYFKDDQLCTGQLWILSHYAKDNIIWIEYIKDCGSEGYLFKGKINNKSEYKRVLKMIGV